MAVGRSSDWSPEEGVAGVQELQEFRMGGARSSLVITFLMERNSAGEPSFPALKAVSGALPFRATINLGHRYSPFCNS